MHDTKMVKSLKSVANDRKQVLDILLPELKKKFNTVKNRKDPRLGHTISNKLIVEQGTKIM